MKVHIHERKIIKKSIDWIVWLLLPWLKGVRWFFMLLLAIFIFYGVRVDFLEIPLKGELIVVSGKFLMPPDMGLNKRGQYAIRVLGEDRVVYKCDCSFGGVLNINCLSRDYLLNNKYIEQLRDERVSLLLAPGPVGGVSSCYELSSPGNTWFSYEEQSAKYIAAKNGWHSKISWLLLVIVITLVIARGFSYKGGEGG